MLNRIRKILRLSPYNRPAPTIKDFKDTPVTTVEITARPEFEIFPTDTGKYVLYRNGAPVNTYASKYNAQRGQARLEMLAA